jgi:hypothetical protein
MEVYDKKSRIKAKEDRLVKLEAKRQVNSISSTKAVNPCSQPADQHGKISSNRSIKLKEIKVKQLQSNYKCQRVRHNSM